MAGTTLERELTGVRTSRVRFDVAGPADDAEIRRLLRETPMAGKISISLEREPDYFADTHLETKQTIIARDGGRLVCVGACSIRQRFVNGKALRVGYLGGLRLEERCHGRFDILRRGYDFFRELQVENPADFYFTSIAADNERARKFLERGISGIPSYEFMGEFVTILIPTGSGGLGGRESFALASNPDELAELVPLLNRYNEGCQFAPCWSANELSALETLGLKASDFCTAHQNGRVVACGALWDQRAFKQTVIRDYSSWLRFVRPIANSVNRITNRPRLPAVGETLAIGFVSHLAFESPTPVAFLELLGTLRQAARQRGIEYLTLGFDHRDPNLKVVQNNYHCREYRSRIYVVRWRRIGGPAAELDTRVIAPEVALL